MSYKEKDGPCGSPLGLIRVLLAPEDLIFDAGLSLRLWGPGGGDQVVIEGRGHLFKAGIAIERSVEYALHGGHEDGEHQEVENHDRQAEEQAFCTAQERGSKYQADS